MSVKFNKKLEEGPWGEGGRIETEYPYVRGEADVNGKTSFSYANPEKPEDSSTVEFNYDASFKSVEYDSEKKGLTNCLTHENRSYISGGCSVNTDGHDDKKVNSTSRTDTKGDSGTTTGGDNYTGTGGKNIGGAKQGSFTNDADGNTYKTSKGDVITEHTGSEYSSIEGDQIASVSGNKITVIGEGDNMIHVQSGNMDTRVEAGALQIYCADSMNLNTLSSATFRSLTDMTLVSQTKITLKVGSSEIIITNSNITIKSPRIDLNP
jgi:hypothetical protein